MKQLLYFSILVFLLPACGTKKVVTENTNSQNDLAYIQTFHNALRYKLKGQTTNAIQAFDSCLVIRPTDDAAAFGLSQCYLQIDNKTKATQYTEMASKLDPNNIWYTQELGYMYYNQGKFVESEKCFAKMVKAQPANVDWLFAHADLLKRLNRQTEAINSLDKMEDQLGVLPDLSIQKFELYLSLKQDEKAIAEIEKARTVFPDELSLIGTLVDYYFSKREVSKAQNMLVELVKNDPSNVRANIALGDLFYRQLNKPEAYKYFIAGFQGTGVDIDTKMSIVLEMYEKQPVVDKELIELADLIIANYPTDAKGYSVKGDLLLKNNEKEAGLAAYKSALTFEQNKFPIWNQVLMLEYELLKFDDLYKDARACSALFPTISSVQLLYTIACVQLDHFQEAIDAADMGKELVVNDPAMESEFFAQKGDALFGLKKNKEGIESYEKAVSIDPTNLLTKNNYAMRLALSNTDLIKAEKLIDEVLMSSPKVASFIDTKGIILFKKGNFKGALEQFVIADELDKENKNYTEHLGDAFFKLGDISKALEYWKKALSLGSKNKLLTKKIQSKSYVDPEY
ncbi:tetratricopeptide repeat protein [Fluviicola taffensis]|uniref:Tetratricopeptide TPR_1 repeat-containing protein n=1 Tax=Fluviicola taffensis (strain DSM 16823 / NCIMB 13979 / RW262) TaxID=755732 RepID=F2IG04_FLUTR|nr:tetratricopeptide repeat protein [Fluviicola taffensis]AEA43625.1 Tetratricopeptide TPR_1 repeat-containing protein [Fluviicola taffensis DSM 16823]